MIFKKLVNHRSRFCHKDNNSLKLQMWDSAGLERYRALIPSYVRGASIIFIIYDVSSKESFSNLGTWINFIKQVNTDNSMMVLCGNKTDLGRNVTTQEGQTLANKVFFEVSAKSGENVNRMMYSCIADLPFFEQFQIGNKEQLVKDLEGGNKKEQNSIYDIVKDQKNEKPADLTVKEQIQNQDGKEVEVVVVKRKKKKGCC